MKTKKHNSLVTKAQIRDVKLDIARHALAELTKIVKKYENKET